MLQICHDLAKMSHGSTTMTDPTIPAFSQPDLEGRSVRDVVESSPGHVNEAWCRKVLRKILHSLELQYGMQMPHRAITPDTIVFHANGEPLLISDDIDAAPAPDARQADDLTALAQVIHYAITHELAPAGPLDGRVAGYSAALVATIDACMDPDPARRPQNVAAVRSLLDRVAPAPLADAVADVPAAAPQPHVPPAAATAAAPAPAATPAPVERAKPEPAVETHRGGMRRGQRRAVVAGGGAIAIALALILVARLPDAGPDAPITPALPQAPVAAQPRLPEPGSAVATAGRTDQAAIGAPGNRTGPAVPVAAPDAAAGTARNAADGLAADAADSPASGASSGGTTRGGGSADASDDMAPAAPNRASAAERVAATAPPGVAPGNASYQLQIKPWGNVYVDGVDRGVSPPLKRLALTPGRHTVRITNPQYRDSILEFESAGTTSNGKIIVDFDHEAQ